MPECPAYDSIDAGTVQKRERELEDLINHLYAEEIPT
jgi:hypothetical protein